MYYVKSYYYLAVRWIQIMGDCIDQETSFSMTFLQTFRQGLQQEITSKIRPFCNDKYFDNLCNVESPYVP